MELNRDLYIDGVSDYLENGLNLFDGTWESGSINNSGADTSSTTSIRSNYVSIAPNTSYYFSSITSSEVSELWANYYSNGVFVSREYLGVTNSKNFTTPAGVNQVRFRITFSDTVTANVISNVMLNKGSIQLPYEPYRKYVTEDYLKNGKNKANIPTHTIAGQGTDYRIVDIQENTTYTLSCVKTRLSGVTITNGALIMFLKLDFYNGSTKISSATLPSAVSFTTGSRYLTYTFTTPANCDNILLNLGNNNGDNNKNTSVSRVMLNKGSTAFPYEEYYGGYVSKGYLEPLIDNLNSKTAHYISEIGLVSVTGASNQWGWNSITYTKTYETAPQIYLQEYANAYAPYQATVVQQTTTGCSVGIYNKPNETHRYMYMVVV